MSENIYGIHAVQAVLANAPERLIEVYALKGREDKRLQPLLNELYNVGVSVQFLNRQTLDKKADGEVSETDLPTSNVLYYELSNNSWCCVRPSGTEPKIKFYMGVKGSTMKDAENQLAVLSEAMKKFVD